MIWGSLLKWGLIGSAAYLAYLILSGHYAMLLNALQQEFRWLLP